MFFKQPLPGVVSRPDKFLNDGFDRGGYGSHKLVLRRHLPSWCSLGKINEFPGKDFPG